MGRQLRLDVDAPQRRPRYREPARVYSAIVQLRRAGIRVYRVGSGRIAVNGIRMPLLAVRRVAAELLSDAIAQVRL